MSVMTPESRWRLLVGAAPVVGVAFFVWAAAQGQPDLARSPTARAILAAVAALGTIVAWWTARQLRAAPGVAVARAAALGPTRPASDIVTLRGRARALPDAVPLVSPDGELCLWFDQNDDGAARVSLRPFLLVDDSGECIVLPAGATVSGQGPVPARTSHPGERLIRNGDRLQVTGRFAPASPEALQLQAETASLVARSEASPALLRGGEPRPFRDLRAAALAGGAFVAAPPPVPQGLPLPVISAPASGASALSIRIGADGGEGGVFGLLAVVDCLVLLVASSLVVWSMLGPA